MILSTLIIISGMSLVFALGKTKIDDSELSVQSRDTGSVAGATANRNDGSVDLNLSGDYLSKFAKYLNDNGMVLYGSFQSPDSIKQKEVFGESANLLDYVECDASGQNANTDECIGRGIDTYPTWLFEGKQYKGIQSLSELAKITSFSQ